MLGVDWGLLDVDCVQFEDYYGLAVHSRQNKRRNCSHLRPRCSRFGQKLAAAVGHQGEEKAVEGARLALGKTLEERVVGVDGKNAGFDAVNGADFDFAVAAAENTGRYAGRAEEKM